MVKKIKVGRYERSKPKGRGKIKVKSYARKKRKKGQKTKVGKKTYRYHVLRDEHGMVRGLKLAKRKKK